MRVLIGAECFLPAVNGVTNSVIRTLAHLERRGHAPMVIAPGPGPSSHELPGGTVAPVERVTSLRPSIYPSLTIGLASSSRIARVLDVHRPDVVHLAAPTVLGRVIGRVAAERAVPVVSLFQTDLSGFAANYSLGFADKVIWSWLRRIHNGCELTLAPAPSVATKLRSHGFQRVGVWGRGVDHDQFDPARRSDALRAEFGAAGSDVLVGYVGRLAAEKQIDRLTTLGDLPNVKLVIVGDGPDATRLQRLMPNAHFAGFRSGADLGAAVASLDLFVHTGPHETYCQAVQEAMAARVAVVAPNAGGPVDLIDHGRTGVLFDHQRPGRLRSAVAGLVSDPDQRAQLANAAHREVAGRSWTALGDDLLDHYRRAIHLLSPAPITRGSHQVDAAPRTEAA